MLFCIKIDFTILPVSAKETGKTILNRNRNHNVENLEVDFLITKEKTAVPVYKAIMNDIKFKIASGEWSLGERLPSYRELAYTFEVNPRAVIVALEELEKQGLLVYNEGNYFTVTKKNKSLSDIKDGLAREELKRFMDAMAAINYPDKKIQEMIIQESSLFDLEEE